MTKISVLFLVFNEVETIENDISNLVKILDQKYEYELIIMQDGSSDGTYEKLNALEKMYNFVNDSKIDRRGYSRAFLEGVKKCKNDIILFSDTGNKYNFANIPVFIEYFKENNLDLLSGYRYKRKDKLIRRLLTYFYSLFINILFLKRFKDYDCGFKVFNRDKIIKILEKYQFTKYLMTSQIFLYFLINKYKVSELKIEYQESKARTSRGIPTKQIPKVIFVSIVNLIKIRLKSFF